MCVSACVDIDVHFLGKHLGVEVSLYLIKRHLNGTCGHECSKEQFGNHSWTVGSGNTIWAATLMSTGKAGIAWARVLDRQTFRKENGWPWLARQSSAGEGP